MVGDRTHARFSLFYSSRKCQMCSQWIFTSHRIFPCGLFFSTYRLKYCKRHKRFCVLRSYSFLLVKTQEPRSERLVQTMPSLTTLQYGVTLQTPVIILMKKSGLDEIWTRNDCFSVVIVGYLDDQCRNLVRSNSSESAQPLPASQVRWALLASVFPAACIWPCRSPLDVLSALHSSLRAADISQQWEHFSLTLSGSVRT